jgi:hypothetical protein
VSNIPDDIRKKAYFLATDVLHTLATNNVELIQAASFQAASLIDGPIATALLSERQRAVRNPNPHLLLAAKHVLRQFDGPRIPIAQYTAFEIAQLRAAVAEVESLPEGLQGLSKPLCEAMTAAADHLYGADGVGGE